MKNIIRPYADLEEIFKAIEYRAHSSEQWHLLDVGTGSATHLVQVDDLRTIPTHEFRVHLQSASLKPHYENFQDDIQLAVIVRDTTLRREVRLAEFPVAEVPDLIALDRSALRTTSLRDRLTINFVVLWNRGSAVKSLAPPRQRGSRLADVEVILRNTAGGASFPFKRVAGEEFKKAGLPSDVGLHLKLYGDSRELISKVDAPLRNLFEVWVHERLWAAIQNDRSPVAAPLRNSAITLMTSNLLLGEVAIHVRKGEAIEPGSVVGQLLEYVEGRAGVKSGDLLRKFQSEASVSALEPYLQHAWRFLADASKLEEEFSE